MDIDLDKMLFGEFNLQAGNPKLQTINTEELDFLSVTDEDIQLSQTCTNIEEIEVSSGLEGLIFTDEGKIPPIKDKAESASKEPTRFENVSESEMDDLVKKQENFNTKKNSAWVLLVFDNWFQEVMERDNLCIPEIQ